MTEIGWTPRAAGWFTRLLAPGRVGVAVVTTAVKYAARGEARASVIVGLRDDEVESLVSRLSGERDRGYRQRTVMTNIGYLMFYMGWHEWPISAETADASAAAMATAVRQDGELYLAKLASDDVALAAVVRAGLLEGTGTMYRVPIIEALQGRVEDARGYVQMRRDRLAGKQGPAVDDELRAADAVEVWLEQF